MSDDKGYLDKYEQVEFWKGPNGSRSTAKGNSEHVVHETKNSSGKEGHSTIWKDGGIHNHKSQVMALHG